jgi:hypothetical protein
MGTVLFLRDFMQVDRSVQDRLTNVTDAERLGFSATYTSSEKLEEARVMVLEDRIFTIAVIGQELNVSQGLMYSAVYDSLGFH